MFSETVFCLTFLVWGCIAQGGYNLQKFRRGADQSNNEPIVEDTLKAHNKYRKLHGVPPLKLDDKMNKEATKWAEFLAETGRLEFPSTGSYGVNIFRGDEKRPYFKNSLATDAWYRGIKDFPFGVEPTEAKGTNFAQVVWKSTELLGVGIGRKGRHIYVVAFYFPRGNQFGQFIKNVPPPLQPDEAATDGIKRSRAMYSKNYHDDKIAKEILDTHNLFRKYHGAPPLKLDPKLSEYAFRRAETIAKAGTIVLDPANPYGENIAIAFENCAAYAPNVPILYWYHDKKHYTYGKEATNDSAKRFTQLVWKNTHYIGIGYARDNLHNIYIVAEYHPRGNVPGEYSKNVLPNLFKEVQE